MTREAEALGIQCKYTLDPWKERGGAPPPEWTSRDLVPLAARGQYDAWVRTQARRAARRGRRASGAGGGGGGPAVAAAAPMAAAAKPNLIDLVSATESQLAAGLVQQEVRRPLRPSSDEARRASTTRRRADDGPRAAKTL